MTCTECPATIQFSYSGRCWSCWQDYVTGKKVFDKPARIDENTRNGKKRNETNQNGG